MTTNEKATLRRYLEPCPRWLGRILERLLKTGEIAEGKNQLKIDCERGVVEITRVGVSRFAIGEELDGEEPVLFFEVAECELLVLWGQWLYEPHIVISHLLDLNELWRRNAWFKHLELVRSPFSGIVFLIKSIGRETVSSSGT